MKHDAVRWGDAILEAFSDDPSEETRVAFARVAYVMQLIEARITRV